MPKLFEWRVIKADNILIVLRDGENHSTILQRMENGAESLLFRTAATDYTHTYTVNIIQTGKCLVQKSAKKIV